eukprot:TRINITY_DN22547_c0_g1_i1.p1 TRINITY_DN22547_c0_g1~~TRINITY_DN22547_c0_g1_i1.p1  ORF type:complete len:421 (+),score=82.97 TRINITY_DN22547_c0_g1_i1:80-1264(+)
MADHGLKAGLLGDSTGRKSNHDHHDEGSKFSKYSRSSLVSSKLARLQSRTALLAKIAAEGERGQEDSSDNKVALIIRSSLGVNVCLFFAKLYTFFATGSLSVLASLVDSTIDLVAQTVILVANYLSEKATKEVETQTLYPAGMSRVEPLGVIICAVLMVLAAFQVVQDSGETLYEFWGTETGPHMTFSNSSAALLMGVILLKIALWQWCVQASQKINNVSLEAISLDNYNDMISNTAALVAAVITRVHPQAWYSDPVGAFLISAYIIWAWIQTGQEQVAMLVGRQASPEFLALVREVAETHDPAAQLDVVRAYHFGPKFLVEIEIVMDRKTPLQVSHDVGMLLQHRIEQLEDCERCFVHIDYEHRKDDDHDTSIPIQQKICVERIGSHDGELPA